MKGQALRPTALGWSLLAIALALASTAWWQPEPHGVLLAVGVLAAAWIAWILVPRRLARIDGRWLLPPRIHALEDVTIGLRLAAPGGCPPLQIVAEDPGNQDQITVCSLGGLDEAQTRIAWPVRFPRRGRVTLAPALAACEQPFGLLRGLRAVTTATDAVVLPALGQLERGLQTQLQRWLDEGPVSDEVGDEEIDHLRRYRAGDPLRQIHWRASARARNLVVTERRAAACRRLGIVLDNGVRHGHSSRRLERLISIAATLVVELDNAGWQIGLYGPFVNDGPILADPLRMLEALALAESQTPVDLNQCIPGDRASVVLTTRSDCQIDDHLRAFVLTLDDAEAVVHPPRHR